MPARVSDGLYVDRRSPVHRLPAHVKIVALVAFVLAVVATPREQVWAFGVHAVALLAVVAVARLPPGLVLRRMVVEVPFVVFALLLPFVAEGERVTVGVGPWAVEVSAAGLLGAWNILAKGTLGVVAAIVLAATTRAPDLVTALQRLRVPELFVAILHFMIRYLDIVVDDMRRMRIARESRGFRARHAGQLPVVARAAGALFVRSYERGERVHRAMLARGYAGVMPPVTGGGTGAGGRGGADAAGVGAPWVVASALPLLAVCVAVAALVAGEASAWRP